MLVFLCSDIACMDRATLALESSQLLCSQYFDTGLLSHETRLLFVPTSEDANGFDLTSSEVLKRHARSAYIRVGTDNETFYLFRQWGFQASLSGDTSFLGQVSHGWYSSDKGLSRFDHQVFALTLRYPYTMVRIAGYAWAYEVATEPIVNLDMTDIRLLGDYWGSQIELMSYVKDHLGFELTMFSPEQEVKATFFIFF